MIMSLLLHSELDVNFSDSKRRAALWKAVSQGHHDLMKLLMRLSRLKLNETDRYGVTPLVRAAEGPALQLFYLLLKQAGVCISAQTTQIVPPLWSASRAGNLPAVKALLRSKSVKDNQKRPTGATPL